MKLAMRFLGGGEGKFGGGLNIEHPSSSIDYAVTNRTFNIQHGSGEEVSGQDDGCDKSPLNLWIY